jgi:hypothetical protein
VSKHGTTVFEIYSEDAQTTKQGAEECQWSFGITVHTTLIVIGDGTQINFIGG